MNCGELSASEHPDNSCCNIYRIAAEPRPPRRQRPTNGGKLLPTSAAPRRQPRFPRRASAAPDAARGDGDAGNGDDGDRPRTAARESRLVDGGDYWAASGRDASVDRLNTNCSNAAVGGRSDDDDAVGFVPSTSNRHVADQRGPSVQSGSVGQLASAVDVQKTHRDGRQQRGRRTSSGAISIGRNLEEQRGGGSSYARLEQFQRRTETIVEDREKAADNRPTSPTPQKPAAANVAKPYRSSPYSDAALTSLLPPGMRIGPTPRMYKFGLRATSFSSGYLRVSSGSMSITFQASAAENDMNAFQFSTRLRHATLKHLDEYVFQTFGRNRVVFHLRFPAVGLYTFEVSGVRLGPEESKDADARRQRTLINLFNYAIHVDGTADDISPFPKVYDEWLAAGSMYSLLEPLNGQLPGGKVTRFTVRLDGPLRATSVHLVDNNGRSVQLARTQKDHETWSGSMETKRFGDWVQLRAIRQIDPTASNPVPLLSFLVVNSPQQRKFAELQQLEQQLKMAEMRRLELQLDQDRERLRATIDVERRFVENLARSAMAAFRKIKKYVVSRLDESKRNVWKSVETFQASQTENYRDLEEREMAEINRFEKLLQKRCRELIAGQTEAVTLLINDEHAKRDSLVEMVNRKLDEVQGDVPVDVLTARSAAMFGAIDDLRRTVDRAVLDLDPNSNDELTKTVQSIHAECTTKLRSLLTEILVDVAARQAAVVDEIRERQRQELDGVQRRLDAKLQRELERLANLVAIFSVARRRYVDAELRSIEMSSVSEMNLAGAMIGRLDSTNRQTPTRKSPIGSPSVATATTATMDNDHLMMTRTARLRRLRRLGELRAGDVRTKLATMLDDLRRHEELHVARLQRSTGSKSAMSKYGTATLMVSAVKSKQQQLVASLSEQLQQAISRLGAENELLVRQILRSSSNLADNVDQFYSSRLALRSISENQSSRRSPPRFDAFSQFTSADTELRADASKLHTAATDTEFRSDESQSTALESHSEAVAMTTSQLNVDRYHPLRLSRDSVFTSVSNSLPAAATLKQNRYRATHVSPAVDQHQLDSESEGQDVVGPPVAIKDVRSVSPTLQIGGELAESSRAFSFDAISFAPVSSNTNASVVAPLRMTLGTSTGKVLAASQVTEIMTKVAEKFTTRMTQIKNDEQARLCAAYSVFRPVGKRSPRTDESMKWLDARLDSMDQHDQKVLGKLSQSFETLMAKHLQKTPENIEEVSKYAETLLEKAKSEEAERTQRIRDTARQKILENIEAAQRTGMEKILVKCDEVRKAEYLIADSLVHAEGNTSSELIIRQAEKIVDTIASEQRIVIAFSRHESRRLEIIAAALTNDVNQWPSMKNVEQNRLLERRLATEGRLVDMKMKFLEETETLIGTRQMSHFDIRKRFDGRVTVARNAIEKTLKDSLFDGGDVMVEARQLVDLTVNAIRQRHEEAIVTIRENDEQLFEHAKRDTRAAFTEINGGHYLAFGTLGDRLNTLIDQAVAVTGPDSSNVRIKRSANDELVVEDAEAVRNKLSTILSKDYRHVSLYQWLQTVYNSELADKLSGEVERAKAAIDRLQRLEFARNRALCVDPRALASLRNASKPPHPYAQTALAGVFLALGDHEGLTPTWEACRKRLHAVGNSSIKQRIKNFGRIDLEIALRVEQLLTDLHIAESEKSKGRSSNSSTAGSGAAKRSPPLVFVCQLTTSSSDPTPLLPDTPPDDVAYASRLPSSELHSFADLASMMPPDVNSDFLAHLRRPPTRILINSHEFQERAKGVMSPFVDGAFCGAFYGITDLLRRQPTSTTSSVQGSLQSQPAENALDVLQAFANWALVVSQDRIEHSDKACRPHSLLLQEIVSVERQIQVLAHGHQQSTFEPTTDYRMFHNIVGLPLPVVAVNKEHHYLSE